MGISLMILGAILTYKGLDMLLEIKLKKNNSYRVGVETTNFVAIMFMVLGCLFLGTGAALFDL
jgi:hypothetical protein